MKSSNGNAGKQLAAFLAVLIVLRYSGEVLAESDNRYQDSEVARVLCDMCEQLGVVSDKDAVARQLECNHGTSYTLATITKAAECLVGMEMEIISVPLTRLSERPGPKIIERIAPVGLIVVCRQSKEVIQVLRGGNVGVWSLKRLEESYSGRAVVLRPKTQDRGLAVEPFHVDVGATTPGRVVQAKYTLTNHGNTTWHLVASGQEDCCGGLDVTPRELSVEPGKSGDIHLRLASTPTGEFMRSAKFLTNGLYEPILLLTISGHTPYTVTPTSLISIVRKHQETDRTAVMTRLSRAKQPGRAVSQAGATVRLVNDGRQGERQRWLIVYTMPARVCPGVYTDTVSIMDKTEKHILVNVPVRQEVQADLVVRPWPAFFGFVAPGGKAEQAVTLRSRSGADFTVKSAVADKDVVKLGTPQQRDGTWVVPISVDTSQPGVIDATVTVTTDVPGEETLPIPVYAHITEE